MKPEKAEKKKKKVIDQMLLDELGVDMEELKQLKKKLKKAGAKPEKGVETWFRLASRNLYTRLKIVDTKANILIGANSIIISMALSNIYPRLEESPHIIFALAGLLITNILSISFAIFATIPPAWKKGVSITKTNSSDLMTFEDFSHMELSEYQEKVLTVIGDEKELYPSIISDVHTLGLRLSRKYRLIRSSYLVFLYGIIITIFMFGACHCLLS
jgi:hypothetical protein